VCLSAATQLLLGTSACEVEIIRDVSRTYPQHIHYAQRHGLGQRQLFRVLKARLCSVFLFPFLCVSYELLTQPPASL
jgi:hypothetical protein